MSTTLYYTTTARTLLSSVPGLQGLGWASLCVVVTFDSMQFSLQPYSKCSQRSIVKITIVSTSEWFELVPRILSRAGSRFCEDASVSLA